MLELVLFPSVGSRGQTVRLGSRHLYLLKHLTSTFHLPCKGSLLGTLEIISVEPAACLSVWFLPPGNTSVYQELKTTWKRSPKVGVGGSIRMG